MSFSCLECLSEFESERSLHAHIKKHNIYLHDYYVKHFQKRNLLTNELLPFKNKQSYFENDFNDICELYEWLENEKVETAKNYALSKLSSRIESRELSCAPNEIELFVNCLPSIKHFKKFFKSYNLACEKINTKPMFASNMPKEFWYDHSDIEILTDTREQQPLFFKKQKIQKLDIGDYCLRDKFDYTFVDRKSEDDFKGTLSSANLNRFKKELDRCKSIDCYLFIVIECNLENLDARNKRSAHRANMKYIYHNMRVLQHEYKNNCQFVFSGSRANSEILIPKLLSCGRKVWNVDIQYFINNYELGTGITKK